MKSFREMNFNEYKNDFKISQVAAASIRAQENVVKSFEFVVMVGRALGSSGNSACESKLES